MRFVDREADLKRVEPLCRTAKRTINKNDLAADKSTHSEVVYVNRTDERLLTCLNHRSLHFRQRDQACSHLTGSLSRCIAEPLAGKQRIVHCPSLGHLRHTLTAPNQVRQYLAADQPCTPLCLANEQTSLALVGCNHIQLHASATISSPVRADHLRMKPQIIRGGSREHPLST